MDPAKVKTVADWPTSTTRREVQCFLGFANFYCRSFKVSGGAKQQRRPSVTSRVALHFSLCLLFLIPQGSSYLRLTPLPQELEPFSLSALWGTISFISVPISLTDSLLQNVTMMLVIMSSLLLSWPLKSGGIGWREQRSNSWFLLTIRTCKIWTLLKGSILDRHAGLYSFLASISLCLSAQGPRMANPMRSPGSLLLPRPLLNLNLFFLGRV